MKYAREFVVNAVVGGLLVLLPAYLAVLLLLKGMETVVALASPLLELLPDWARADPAVAARTQPLASTSSLRRSGIESES